MKREERKKIKTAENTSHSNPDHHSPSENQCKWDGNARVSGEISVKLPPDLLKEYKSAHKDNNPRNNKGRLVDWLTLAAVIIYAGLTGWQGCMTHSLVSTAQKTYQASSRPYVGIDGDSLAFYRSVEGKARFQPNGRDKDSVAMKVEVDIKNFGTTPALDFDGGWDVRISGKSLKFTKIATAPTTVFPTQKVNLAAIIQNPQYQLVIDGTATLQFDVWFSYRGQGPQTYSYCDRQQYTTEKATFMDLGQCVFAPQSSRTAPP
jgi:hypothetical protein